jgi:hypothetical protein
MPMRAIDVRAERVHGAGNPAAGSPRPRARPFVILPLMGLTLAAVLHGWELRPSTVAAYDRYAALTEARLVGERAGTAPFLWVDRQPPAARDRLMARLRAGEIIVESLETRDQTRAIDVPDGLLHHWIGTVWMPGVSLNRLVAFVQDYDRYPEFFAPMIVRSRVLSREGDRFVVSMRTSVKKVITVVMDGDYTIEYHRLGTNRHWTTNVVTNLHQVNDAGTAAERRVPGDQASGYLWRFRMYCAFEERPDGSIEQCESITLTRPIPFALGWLVRPFVTGIPRDTIAFTLGQVRGALVTTGK